MIVYLAIKRRNSKPCPSCGKRVKRDTEQCPNCEAKLRWDGRNVFVAHDD